MKPRLLTFLFSFALFILGLSSYAQVEVWNPKYASPNLRATDNYNLAVQGNELQIHHRGLGTDTFIQFNSGQGLVLFEAYDDVFVLSHTGLFWYWVSDDGGKNWDSIHGNPDLIHQQVYIRNQDEHLIITNQGLSKSMNGGASWTTRLENNLISHSVNGNHVLLLFSDHIEISNDFGSTFSSKMIPIFYGDGCISNTGKILLSIKQALFGASMTIYSANQGTTWDTVNHILMPKLRFIDDTKLLYFDSKVYMFDISKKTSCLLNVQGFGGIGFLYESCNLINEQVFVYGKNIVQFPLDQVGCFVPTAVSNPKLILEWADLYVGTIPELVQGGMRIQKVDDRVIFRMANSEKLYASDGSDTLLNQNILIYNEQGSRMRAYHENASGNVYFNPTLIPLPPDKGYMHFNHGNDTFFLSPDRNHFHVIPWNSKNVRAYSILDKDLEYQGFFRFQSKPNNSVGTQSYFVNEERIVLNVVGSDTFEHVDINGIIREFPPGDYRFKFTLQGQLIQVKPWIHSTSIPLQNGAYLLHVFPSLDPLDTVKAAGKEFILSNPKNLRHVWLVLDSSDNLLDYYLAETSNSTFSPPIPTYQEGQILNNIIGISAHQDFTLYRSDGTPLFFPNSQYLYHYVQVSDDGKLNYLNEGMITSVQSVNKDTNFYLSSGYYRIPYDFANEGIYSTKAEFDCYFGLYDDQASLVQDIGPSGSLTKYSLYYGDYPFVYFIGAIDPVKSYIPGNTDHIPISPGFVIGKFRIDATVGIPEIGDENKSIAYPNPTHSSTTFYSAIALETDVNVLIYGVDGRLVKEFRTETENDKVEIDLSSLPSAWYTVKIESGNSSQSLLILKH